MARKGGMGGGGMDTSLLFSNLVITATLGLGAIGWIVAFIGQIAAEANFRHQGVLWFSIFLEVFLILGIAYTVVTNNVGASSHQISLFLAVALVFSVIGIDSGIYAGVASANAVAAGWFILTITNIIWLLFFTSEEDSASYGLLNRFGNGALNGPGSGRRNRGGGGGGGAGSAIRSNGGVHDGTGYGGGFGSQTAGGYQPAFNSGPSAADLSMNASKSNGMAGGAGSIRSGQAAAGMGAGALAGSTMGRSDYGHSSDPVRVPSPTSTHKQSAPGTVEGGAGDPTPGYGYKARALYAYQANSDDPTEISFSKGEVLDIVDNSGKWWQARKSDGETGIVPSNYMQVL